MPRLRRSERYILFALASRPDSHDTYKTVESAAKGMSTLYYASICDENTLESVVLRLPHQKVLVFFLDEVGLQNKRFRRCLCASVAAKLRIILFVDPIFSKERLMLHYFCFPPKRIYEKLGKLIEEAFTYDSVSDILTKTMRQIRGWNYEDMKVVNFGASRIKQEKTFKTDKLKECLTHNKAMLLEPLKLRKTTSYSYNICNTMNRKKLAVSSPAARTLKSAPIRGVPVIKTGSKPKCRTPTDRTVSHEKERSNYASSQDKKRSSKKTDRNTRQKDKNCPTIEISLEDSIDERTTNVPWLPSPSTPSPLFTGYSISGTEKRFSFDYMNKTYAVFHPSSSQTESEITYVNFPHCLKVQPCDKETSSMAALLYNTSRRESAQTNNESSADELNLEYVFDYSRLALDSPIPSPSISPSVMYQDPLPAFPIHTSFPPIEKFPCELLQMRRPSVFDVVQRIDCL